MVLQFETAPGATPLEPEELEQLIPDQITTMPQLNDAEQLNILSAASWALGRRRDDVLSTNYVQELHRRMYGEVWRWAGKFRTSAKNIGNAEAYEIPMRIEQTLRETKYRIENEIYESGEIAIRLHHELTLIHAFPNGNGRHARLMTDVLCRKMDWETFTWGSRADLVSVGPARERYIQALHSADNFEMGPLLEFARS